jgi:DNA-binding MarR family transcriptional regulator
VARNFDLHAMPGYLIRRIDSRAAAVYERSTGQTELTPRQFGLLLVVFQTGSVTQSNLGAMLHLDRSTLGEMLQRVIDRGLVHRQPLLRDRRTSSISLTAEGETVLLAAVVSARESQATMLAPQPDYLQPVFLKCLQLLADAPDSSADQEI